MTESQSPIDMTDNELKAGLREEATKASFSYNDYYREIERRSQNRHARAMRLFTGIIALATIINIAGQIIVANMCAQ